VFILRGNHDYDSDPNIPFFSFLDKLSHIVYISKPTIWNGYEQHSGLDWQFLFLPHSRDPGKDWDLKTWSKTRLSAVFMHQTFRGAVSETGYKLSGIGTSRFRNFDCPIFSGDVHVPQQIGPITYVGSPYHIHFGDRFSPQVLLADEMFRTKSVRFPAPKKSVFDVQSAEDFKKQTASSKAGDMVKIRLHLSINEIGTWSKQRDEIRKIANKLDLRLHGITLKELRKDNNKITPTKSKEHPKVRTRQDTFRTYCARNKVGKGLAETGITIMRDI